MALAISVLIPAAATAQAATPLSAEQTEHLRCAAAFAIVGSEQDRGAPGSEDYPPLAERGGKFIAFVGEGLMQETGQSREEIRGEIGKAISALQQESIEAPDPDELMHDTVSNCMVLLDQLMPPEPEQ